MKLFSTLAAAAVALTAAASASPMALPKLAGSVGPGFTISLKQNGKLVKTLKAGKYTFVVSDKASIHNFQIEGRGIDRAITTVPFKGTKTVTIALKRGTYKYYCVPHESSMHGSFRVV
jgi:plastocyanin